jgi:hypothetical protein
LKKPPAYIVLALLLALPLSGAPAEQTAKLEARLKETAEASPPAAELMLKLIDLYKGDGQVFGLIRTASKFSRSQAEHPRRAEVTLDLITVDRVHGNDHIGLIFFEKGWWDDFMSGTR